VKVADVKIGREYYTYIGAVLAPVVVEAEFVNYEGKRKFFVSRLDRGNGEIVAGCKGRLPKPRSAAALREIPPVRRARWGLPP